MIYTGTVKWFNPEKGYGFIKSDKDKQDIFIHISVVKAAGLHSLESDQKIEYELIEEKNRKSAGNIRLL